MEGSRSAESSEQVERASAALPDGATKSAALHSANVIGRQRGVAGRTVWISILTLLSRLLGMVREVISAGLFGDSSVVYDAFLFAWRIPNLFRRFLGEGALATSLQSSLTQADSTGGDGAGREVFVATVQLLVKLLGLLCGLVMIVVWLMPDRMPGTEFLWLGPHPEVVREFTIRLMPFVIFVCLAAAVGGALNVRGHYTMPALGPVLLNVIWILALLGITAFLVKTDRDVADWRDQLPFVRWLSWGVLVSGLVQLAVMMPALRGRGLWLRSRGIPKPSKEARALAMGVLKRSTPLALGAAVYQVNVMIDGLMAQSLLPAGGQTVHYLANRVQQFPIALVAIAATTAVFPALAALGQQRRLEDLRRLHDQTQRSVLFVALPSTIGLAVLAWPVCAVLFGNGNFGALGVDRTASALRMLSLAILPAGAVGLVARTYYAVGDFKTPVRVSACMLVANACLNFILLRFGGMDADGLALGTTITSFGNLALLLPGLRRHLGLPRTLPGTARAFGRMIVAGALCGLTAAGCQAGVEDFVPRSLALCLAMGSGLAIYLWVSRALGVPEWAAFATRFQGIWGKLRHNSRP